MKIQSITTIEIVSICNLSCPYCITPKLKTAPERRAGIMTEEVFYQSLHWLKVLCDRGSQKEVCLNGNGEPLLDPQIVKRVQAVKDIMGLRRVMFCTNGLLLTEELAYDLKAAGLDRMDVSAHSAVHARRAVDILKRVGIKGVLAIGAIVDGHNWCDQIDEEYWVKALPKIICHPLLQGKAYIQSEGNVSVCCYDYLNLGTVGTVLDDDLLDREMLPYELCQHCHQAPEVRG